MEQQESYLQTSHSLLCLQSHKRLLRSFYRIQEVNTSLARGAEVNATIRANHHLVTISKALSQRACRLSPRLRSGRLPFYSLRVTSTENMVATSRTFLQPPASQSPTSNWSTSDYHIVLKALGSETRYWSPESCLVLHKLPAAT